MEICIIPKDHIHTILPLLNELDLSIGNEMLNKRLDEMVNNGYECLGLYAENKLVGICGIWTLYKYYVGKHIEPDNVYIKPEYRNSGVGKKLVNWLIEFAKSRNCKTIELNCYKENQQGNDFWVKNNFFLLGNHYQLKLE